MPAAAFLTLEKFGRQGPKWWPSRHDSGDPHGEECYHQPGLIVKEGGSNQAEAGDGAGPRHVAEAVGGFVDVPGPDPHGAKGHEIRQGTDQADGHGAEPKPLDDQRKPQLDAVEPGGQAEVDQGQTDHLPADERAEDLPQAMALLGIGLLATQPLDQPVAFVLVQPGRFGRRAGQVAQRDDTDDEGGQGFEDEHPLPAGETGNPIQLEQGSGQRAGDEAGDRNRRDEGCGHAPAPMLGEPQGDVEDDAREQAGLGDTEQEPHQVEAPGALDEDEAHGHEAHADHDARNPAPGAELVQHQIAGNFEEEIRDEEQASAPAKHLGAQTKIRTHGERGEADIDPDDEGDDVEQT